MSKLRIISPFERPLAITEAKLEQIAEVYLRHEAGQKIDFDSILAAVKQNEKMAAAVEQKSSRETGGHGYIVQDGVAIIDVDGVLGKGMNLFMFFSGGTSTELLQNDLSDAVADDTVHSIVLRIDSPGGEVDGTELFANAVAAARDEKPIVAWISGLGASAGYWIASQAGEIILADQTTWVGSIGVVAGHVDRSKSDDQRGIKRTEITAGKYKRIASDTGPLTQDGRQTIQDQVDAIYAVFLQAVADGRDMSADAVHEDMGDGRLFMGQQAIDAGLADGIATLDEVIASLNQDAQQGSQSTGVRASANHAGEKNMKTYTEQEMQTARAEEFARGKAEGKTEGVTEGKAQGEAVGRVTGANAERERIQGVLAQSMPGHNTLVKSLAFDGSTTPEQAAVKVLGAHREALVKAGADLEADAAAIAPASAADPKAEGEAAKQAVAKETGKGAETAVIDPRAHAEAIRNHVAKAKSEGRTISSAQADAEIAAASK